MPARFFLIDRSRGGVSNIYDIRGRVVRSLMNESQEAGEHTAVWNGTDDNGRALASGVYLYRLETTGKSVTRKCVLMK
jgi:flagellar hook assembly protein FlgD